MTYLANSLSPFAIEALLRIVRLLEVLPDENFNLAEWFAETECGTTACALGTAALNPWFEARGLRLYRWGGTIQFTDADGSSVYGIPAAVQLLGITLDQAMYLFTAQPGYFHRKQVIRRIGHFVARNGAEDTGPLQPQEQMRLDGLLRDLDARLAQERAKATEAFMHKVNKVIQSIKTGCDEVM